jgi:glycosyltransferase involved in cell wall biosynthesis
MPPLDVAFLLGSPDISGGSNVIFEHAAGLHARGHRVAIVTERPVDPARLRWHERAQGLAFLDHAACRDRLFDVAVATWWRTVFDLPFVPARRQAYFVQSIETRFAEATDHESRALVDFTYRLPLPAVTEASWIRRYLAEHYGRDAALVRNGIDKARFTPDGPRLDETRPTGLRVLVEGPVDVPFKRVPLAVRLCAEAGIEDVWLLTLSEPGRLPGVRRVLSRVPITDVPAVYRSCDVLLKLSTVEGMFGPPLEMMHCGGTCITSDVTGFEEYVEDGQNAIVVPRGEEHRAVDALRRLAANPALLAHLRRGALATAAAWPGWDVAVAGMERFLREVAGAPDDAAALRAERLDVLRAALALAGPLRVSRDLDRWTWHFTYPVRGLLHVGARLARSSVRRALQPVWPARARPAPPPATRLPAPGRAPARAPAGALTVCFVGDPTRHRAHAPLDGDDFHATFVGVPAGTMTDDAIAAIRGGRPDWTVVFAPERLAPETRRALPGIVVGIVTNALSDAAIARLRATFPLDGDGTAASCVVHPDEAVRARLLAAGVNAVAAFLPPVDLVAFAAAADDDWTARAVPVLALVDDARTAPRVRRLLGERGEMLEVVGPHAETMLAPLLRAARLSLHLGAADDPLGAAKVVRDLVAGCLVVAPPLVAEHGLLAGEHYLAYECEEDVERVVHGAFLTPERFEVVRRVGRARALDLAAPRRYLDLFAQLVEPPATPRVRAGAP